jgi:DNA invertase Pin-like site-specific DNA recombinase
MATLEQIVRPFPTAGRSRAMSSCSTATASLFVAVTQQFNTTTSMGRLTLNILLSFAQFEREVIGERVRDKIAASKKKGMWMGGVTPLGMRSRIASWSLSLRRPRRCG